MTAALADPGAETVTARVTQPGVYDIPDHVYHGDPVPGGSLSSSGARRLLPPSCPAHFKWEQDHPRFESYFDLGSAAHLLVLGAGPELVVIDAEDWRTKAARAERDEAREKGKTPVLKAEHGQVLAMAAALRQHPVASALFSPDGGQSEQSLFWQDPETGVWCRARLDWLPDSGYRNRLILGDYKTTSKSADPASIARSVANFGYHQQDAFYCDGIRALGIDEDPAFLFVFQETTPPYLITVAELDSAALRAGRERNRRAIEIYRDCKEAGKWPGYPDEIQLISLPPWALRTGGNNDY